MKNHYRLLLPFNPTISKFKLPLVAIKSPLIHHFNHSILSDECLDWIKEINLTFKKALIFEGPPGTNNHSIHIDGYGKSARKFGVNWNFNTVDFEMCWYRPLTDGIIRRYQGTNSITFRDEDVELIETSRISDPLLFRTDIPHCVVNYSNETRHSLSLVFEEPLSWGESVDYFRNYIIHQ